LNPEFPYFLSFKMSNEIDIARIQDAYANMHDEELLEFTKNDGLKISADAFVILKKELNKRNIGAAILRELEHEIILQASLNNKRLVEDVNKNLFYEAVEFSLIQKEKGTSNYDIYAGLIEMGVTEEYSNYIVNKLPGWADNLHRDSKTEFQAGVGILILGIIAMYAAVAIDRFQIAAAVFILIGIIRIVLWATKRNRYKKILETIKAEEER
jgi:hypothetical protein